MKHPAQPLPHTWPPARRTLLDNPSRAATYSAPITMVFGATFTLTAPEIRPEPEQVQKAIAARIAQQRPTFLPTPRRAP